MVVVLEVRIFIRKKLDRNGLDVQRIYTGGHFTYFKFYMHLEDSIYPEMVVFKMGFYMSLEHDI